MKKHTYEYVNQYIEKENYKLLSTEYINSDTKLKIQCPYNHIFKMKYNDFQQGVRCPVCHGTPKYSYEYVKTFIEKENYQLLSTKYKGIHNKLDIKCNNDHIFHMTFGNFKNGGQRCPQCSHNNKKLTYGYVKEFIENKNYRLISEEYINCNTKLEIQCDKGHLFKTLFRSIQSNHLCPICAKNNQKLTHDYVKNYIKNKGYELLSNEYENNHTKLRIKCKKNHIFNMTYGHFRNGSRCPICVNKRSTPEKIMTKFIKKNYNFTIIENTKEILINPFTKRKLELDIFLPELNKAIEFNGRYWHHKDNKIIKRDKIKKGQCINKGIDLLVINEKDWINDKKKCLISVKKFLGSD